MRSVVDWRTRFARLGRGGVSGGVDDGRFDLAGGEYREWERGGNIPNWSQLRSTPISFRPSRRETMRFSTKRFDPISQSSLI